MTRLELVGDVIAVAVGILALSKTMAWAIGKTLSTHHKLHVQPSIVEIQTALTNNASATEANTRELTKAQEAAVAVQSQNAQAFNDLHAIVADHETRITVAERVLAIDPPKPKPARRRRSS